MNITVFITVLSGVLTYVIGQLVSKLLIEPVQEMKKTISEISLALIEHSQVIHNPGVLSEERTFEAVSHLRKLSSKLHAHLYLVPKYNLTAKLFGLPEKTKLLSAAADLLTLSNSVFKASDKIYEQNAKRQERICDSLSIYFPEDKRWPIE